MASVTPKIYILKYDLDSNIEEKRAPYRDAHQEYFKKYIDNGNIILSGLFEDPIKYHMSFIRNLSEREIDELVRHDPYFIHDVVNSYRIIPFFAVSGDPVLKNDLVEF